MKNIFNSKLGRILSYLVFWTWNLIFLIFVGAVIIPTIGVGILDAAFSGEIPFDFFLFLVIGTAIPIVSVVLGLTKFINDPKKLFQLFYGLEIPMGFILFLRLVLLKELTPGTWQLLILLIVGGAIFLYDLFTSKEHTNKLINTIRLIGHSALLMIAVYFGIIMLFFFVPALAAIVIGFFSFEWIDNIWVIFQGAFIAFFFIITSGTILLILPIAMPTLYIKKFIAGIKEFNERYSTNFTLGISASFIIINIFLFVKINEQPQQEIFALLEKENITQVEKRELLENEEAIKEGLLNSYLASYRYISTKNNDVILEIYSEVFLKGSYYSRRNNHYNKTNPFNIIQEMYNAIIKPFVYDGENHSKEKQKAERLYAEFFDAPIQKSERETVKHALQATWDRDAIEAGLLNINDEKVLILEQNITLKEENGTAEVEISELYENKTHEQQEIFYYFSLPENAVITGLWLSDDGTDKKYSYTVSPRGAAQQVYKNEVQRQVDPSLLEQTGPGQYRLRAFPIPAVSSWERNLPDYERFEYDNKLKLWLRYVCIAKDGVYPLPHLSEKRNVFWTNKTEVSINDKKVDKNENWLPESIPATSSFTYKKTDLNKDVCLTPSKIKSINNNMIEGKIAVYIDQSYSMNKLSIETLNTINELKKLKADVHILYTSNKIINTVAAKDFKADELLFYGSSTFYEVLSSLKYEVNTANYNELIIITDGGSYELNKNIAKAETWWEQNDTLSEVKESERKSIGFTMPVSFLHLDYNFPKSYDDMVLETIEKTNGSVAGNLEDLLQQIIAKKTYSASTTIADTYSGILWTYSENNSDTLESSNPYTKALAAKQYIKMRVKQHETISIDLLDKIHELAKSNSIVTPYSSMIVLVNDRQKEALKKAEQADDRFDRETETGIESMSNSDMNITGTPEPEEWLLIIITALMLLFMYSKYFRR